LGGGGGLGPPLSTPVFQRHRARTALSGGVARWPRSRCGTAQWAHDSRRPFIIHDSRRMRRRLPIIIIIVVVTAAAVSQTRAVSPLLAGRRRRRRRSLTRRRPRTSAVHTLIYRRVSTVEFVEAANVDHSNHDGVSRCKLRQPLRHGCPPRQ